MTVGLEKDRLLGLRKYFEPLPSKTVYSFSLSGISKRVVELITENKIGVRDISARDGVSLQIKCLNGEEINEANLMVPGKDGKLVPLRWKKS